jgi:hypothetical protein
LALLLAFNASECPDRRIPFARSAAPVPEVIGGHLRPLPRDRRAGRRRRSPDPAGGPPRDYLLTQLMAFRTGDRKATIMHQITRGYSELQLEQLAGYFSTLK